MFKFIRHFSSVDNASKLSFKKAIEKPPTIAPLLKVVKIDHSSIEKEYPCTSQEKGGELVRLSSLLKSTISRSKTNLPNDICRHFSLFKNNVLLNRSSIIALLSKTQRTVLDGSTGIGKSTNLLLLVDMLLNSKNRPIIVYLTKASTWIDGKFSYEYMEEERLYSQDELAHQIYTSILAFNPSLSDEYSFLIKDDLPNSLNVSRFLEKLPKSKTIFVIDEIESLFSKINYRNMKSEQLLIDDFILLKTLKKIIQDPTTSFIGSTCRSNSNLQSSSILKVPFTNIKQVKPFSLEESQSLLTYYSKMGHLFSDDPLKISSKIHLVSGGIPKAILKAVSYNHLYTKP